MNYTVTLPITTELPKIHAGDWVIIGDQEIFVTTVALVYKVDEGKVVVIIEYKESRDAIR